MTTSNNEPPVTNGGAELTGSLSLVGNLSVNGNVGIGTTSPKAKLDVQGIIQTYNKDNSGANWDNIQIWSDGTHGYIESNGDEDGLKIKSNTAKKIILDSAVEVKGTLKLNSGVAVNEFSTDENLGNSDSAVPTQKAVKTYVDNKINDLESTINDLESTINDLESTINDLESTINDLESKNNNLESTINDLESKNNNLESTITDLKSKINDLESKINSIDFKNLEVTTLSAEKITIGVSDFHFVLEVLYKDKKGKRIDGHIGLALRKRGNPENQGFLIETDGSMRDRTDISILTQ